MKSIDIKTTQNVVISYELASPRDRVLAFVIDLLIKIVCILLLLWFFTFIYESLNLPNRMFDYFLFLAILPVSTFYTLLFEFWMNGQTPGKKLLKIKVVKMDGNQPVFYDHILRWSFRIIDVWLSLGSVATILIASSDFAQRIGDITSNCTVVKMSNQMDIHLRDLMKIESLDNYSPKFPAIAQFREEDILLIKQVLERYQRYNNDAHKKVLLDLCHSISSRLNIVYDKRDPSAFLKTLIKDYIVLTR